MHTGFKIKVSDLLQHPGKTDELEFENKTTSKIPHLVAPLYGKIYLQSLNDTTILVRLDLNTTLRYICDYTGKEYDENVVIRGEETKFTAPISHSHPDEEIHDDEFLIDMAHETIDIEDFIVQSILFQEPVSKVYPGYEPQEDEEDEGFGESHHISFK